MNKLLEKLFDKFDKLLHGTYTTNYYLERIDELEDDKFNLADDLEEANETISMYVDNAEVIRRIR